MRFYFLALVCFVILPNLTYADIKGKLLNSLLSNEITKEEINDKDLQLQNNLKKDLPKTKINHTLKEEISKIESDFNQKIDSNITQKLKKDSNKQQENNEIKERSFKIKEQNPKKEYSQKKHHNTTQKEDSIKQETSSHKNKSIIKQFGYETFENINITNLERRTQPVINVKSNQYKLKPFDKIKLTFYGNTNQTQDKYLNNEGEIFLEGFKPISLLNLTIVDADKKLNNLLKTKLNNSFAKLEITKSAPIKINIIGEVKFPGFYITSDRDNILNVLALAGGIKKTGSLRTIEIIRNQKIIKTLDLYNTFLNLKQIKDLNLKENDTVFVPEIKKVILIKGQVNRENIFEITKKTFLKELIDSYAGGKRSLADENKVFILRKDKNHYKKLNIQSKDYKNFLIQHGDRIIVPTINMSLSNPITIKGEIANPGAYGFENNFDLEKLIKLSGGFRKNADIDYIKVTRISSSNTIQTIRLNWRKNKSFKLNLNDTVEVVSINNQINQELVNVEGNIQFPGSYPIDKSITLEELINLAKPAKNSDLKKIEVNYSANQKRKIVDFTQNKKLILRKNDSILIRKGTKEAKAKFINIKGEVNFPGKYPILNGDKISTIIKRAGGLTQDAHLKGLIFKRESLKNEENNIYNQIIDEEIQHLFLTKPPVENISEFQDIQIKSIQFLSLIKVNQKNRISLQIPDEFVDLEKSQANINLEDKDIIIIPIKPQSVQVAGGVNAPGYYPYSKNKSIKHYIKLSGGYTHFSIKNKFYVYKANGTMIYNPKIIEQGDAIYIKEQIKLPVKPLDLVAKLTQVIFQIITAAAAAGVSF